MTSPPNSFKLKILSLHELLSSKVPPHDFNQESREKCTPQNAGVDHGKFYRHVKSYSETVREKALLELIHQIEVVDSRMSHFQRETNESLTLVLLEMKKQSEILNRLLGTLV